MNFFKQFSLDMNALDNKSKRLPSPSPLPRFKLPYHSLVCYSIAKNHINRLCLATGVTLIKSGSAGYLGQVTVIRKVIKQSFRD